MRAGIRAAVCVLAIAGTPGVAGAQDVPAPPAPPLDLTSIGIDAGTVDALDSGSSLGDVELYSGELIDAVRDANAEISGAELYAAGALEIDPAALREAARQAALAQAQAQAAARCAISAPPGTLRGGSARVGLQRICVESVRAARTPQAAEAMIYLFRNLGTPYSQERRSSDGFYDCSSYVMRAFESAGMSVKQGGWYPTTHALAPHSGWSSYGWLRDVAPKDARPGDLLLWVPPERTGHVAMQLWGGYMIHTASTGDVSHIHSDRALDAPHVIRRVVP